MEDNEIASDDGPRERPIVERYAHFCRSSHFLSLGTEDGEWEVHFHDTFNENGIKWTIIGANVIFHGILTDI